MVGEGHVTIDHRWLGLRAPKLLSWRQRGYADPDTEGFVSHWSGQWGGGPSGFLVAGGAGLPEDVADGVVVGGAGEDEQQI